MVSRKSSPKPASDNVASKGSSDDHASPSADSTIAATIASISLGPGVKDSFSPYGMPYFPFSKGEKIGRAANWMNEDSIRDSMSRHQSHMHNYGLNYRFLLRNVQNRKPDGAVEIPGQNFGYVHFEKDDSFAADDFSTKSGAHEHHAPHQRQNNSLSTRGGRPSIFANDPRFGGSKIDPLAEPRVRRTRGYGAFGHHHGTGARSYNISSSSTNHHQGGGNYARNRNQNITYGGGYSGRGGRSYRSGYQNYSRVVREPSYQVPPEWKPTSEFDLNKLSKLAPPSNFVFPQSTVLSSYGILAYYDHNYDSVSVRNEVPLKPSPRSKVANVSTSADPIIRAIINKEKTSAKPVVFATDEILSQLMVSPRSVFPWDIVLRRVGKNQVFLDRRRSVMDLVTVNENAPEFYNHLNDQDTKDHGKCDGLSLEATYINANYTQQVVNHSRVKKMSQPSPFFTSAFGSTPDTIPSCANIYNKWTFQSPSHGEVALFSRSQIDAVLINKGEEKTLCIRALNNVPVLSGSSATGTNASNSANNAAAAAASAAAAAAVSGDWRQKLDTQRGAVMANEIKNNSSKIARWTLQALLADADWMHIGFVARATSRDVQNHSILGSVMYRPAEIATQTNLSLPNAWAILATYIDAVLKQPEGVYLLIKDPNQGIVRLYSVPSENVNSDLLLDVNQD